MKAFDINTMFLPRTATPSQVYQKRENVVFVLFAVFYLNIPHV